MTCRYSLALEYNHANVLMDLDAMEDMQGGKWLCISWFPLQAFHRFLTLKSQEAGKQFRLVIAVGTEL